MNVRVVSVCLWIGERSLTVVPVYWPNGNSKYPAFLEALEGLLEGDPTADRIVLLRDDTSRLTWRGVTGRDGLPDLHPSGVLLSDICGSHSLSTSNSMFENDSVHQCALHQDTTGQRLETS